MHNESLVAIGRKNLTFCGSDEVGRRAATVYTLIETCKLNDIDPQAWLAHVLEKLPDHPAKRIDELLPWNWKAARDAVTQPPPATATIAAYPPRRCSREPACGPRRVLSTKVIFHQNDAAMRQKFPRRLAQS